MFPENELKRCLNVGRPIFVWSREIWSADKDPPKCLNLMRLCDLLLFTFTKHH